MNSNHLFLWIVLLMAILISGDHLVKAENEEQNLNQDGVAHEPLIITSDTQVKELANSEGWDGLGSESNPFVIKNYRFSGSIENSTMMNSIKRSTNYDLKKYDSFTKVNLILSNITASLKIENNEFMYSVIIINSKNIELMSNTWINHEYPSNLFINVQIRPDEGRFIVHDNIFDGINEFCGSDNESPDDYTPRIYLYGGGITIEHNIFEIDDGCFPIAQIELNARQQFGQIQNSNFTSNWFRSSDLAILYKSGYVQIYNNDFETGDTAIVAQYESFLTSIIVYHNNFFSSKIGQQGKQNYEGTIYFVHGLKLSIFENYYDVWVEPDNNGDGIVDDPYLVYNEGPGINLYDYKPSTARYPGYHGEHENGGLNNFEKLALALISMVVTGYSIVYLYPRYIKKVSPFTKELNEVSKQFISELFESQTVLYYTLVGQSKFLEKEVDEKIREAVPRDLWSFKFLLHPTRLALMKLLYENLDLTSIDLKDILKLSWNEFYSHAYSLEKKGYIVIEDKFVEDLKRQVLQLSQQGLEEYKMLTDLLHLFLDNSVDYQAYITAAQKRLDESERDLYPES